jgi:TonB family protein
MHIRLTVAKIFGLLFLNAVVTAPIFAATIEVPWVNTQREAAGALQKEWLAANEWFEVDAAARHIAFAIYFELASGGFHLDTKDFWVELTRRVTAHGLPTVATTDALPITPHQVTADDYPVTSRRLEEEGIANIAFVIDEMGKVNRCYILKTSGKPMLDDAACTLVKTRWLYKPATEDGKPVPAAMTANIAFTLTECTKTILGLCLN